MQTSDSQLKCEIVESFGYKGFFKLWVNDELRVDRKNLKTEAGRAAMSDLMIAGGTLAPTHIALGDGDEQGEGATALDSERYREAATKTQETRAYTDDTSRYEKTFDIDATYTLTEAGLLNAASGGDLFALQCEFSIDVESGDKVRVQWDLQH